MADYIITERSNLVDVADSIRSKTGETDNLTLGEMIKAVNRSVGGGVSSWNDLTDKPFNIVELMPETEFMYDDETGFFGQQTDFQFVAGKTYVVKYNGVEYTTTAKFGTFDSGDYNIVIVLYVGNDAVFGGDNNGLPFALAVVPFIPNYMGMIICVPLDGATSVTAGVKAVAASALYKDPYAPMILDARMEDGSDVLEVIYGDEIEVSNAFLSGREIVVMALNGFGGYRYTVTGCWMTGFVFGDLAAGSTLPSTILELTRGDTESLKDYLRFQYNGDGTFVPYE